MSNTEIRLSIDMIHKLPKQEGRIRQIWTKDEKAFEAERVDGVLGLTSEDVKHSIYGEGFAWSFPDNFGGARVEFFPETGRFRVALGVAKDEYQFRDYAAERLLGRAPLGTSSGDLSVYAIAPRLSVVKVFGDGTVFEHSSCVGSLALQDVSDSFAATVITEPHNAGKVAFSPEAGEALITLSEAANRFQRDRSTIRQAAARGCFPSLKIGREIFLPEGILTNYFAHVRRGPKVKQRNNTLSET